jgi:hypothetical protein
MVGSMSVATIAVSSAKMAVVASGEVGRSAVYSRYSNGLRTLPRSTLAFAGKTRKCLRAGSLGGETVLVCTVFRYAILCRMIVRYRI